MQDTTIDYGKIYDRVDSFLQTREGLANPKNAQDYVWFVRELTGIFCGAAYENDLSTDKTLTFFDLVEDHYINDINLTGKLCNVEDLIGRDIVDHPLYHITEFTLMNYKPGNVQVGPGEFFFCFYDRGSTFGIDNMAGYDVITDSVTTEMKKLGSNFTTPELFDKYAASDAVQRLLVVKPISNAKKPRIRSQYACTSTTEWRKAFYHKNGATLALKEL